MSQNGEVISVRGARTHNLRNLDLDIPRDRLVVITGVSGSGKSSLAFDTLYAEGQRRFIESLSVYARQFIDQMPRPDVDLIEGLPPTISIDQRAGSANPRSTVATVTEIYDSLRVLYARAGTPHCWQCGEAIHPMDPGKMVDLVLSLEEGRRVMVLAPMVRGRKGLHKEVFEKIRRERFVRARVDGNLIDVTYPPELNRNRLHNIEAVVDRIVVREGIRNRLAESIGLAIQHGEGAVIITHEQDGDWHDRLLSTSYACLKCQVSGDELAPRSFSFNSPYGACPECDGLGYRVDFDPDLVIPDPSKSIADGAIAPWRKGKKSGGVRQQHLLAEFLGRHRIDAKKNLSRLSPKQRQCLMEGDGEGFPGVLGELRSRLESARKESVVEALSEYRCQIVCAQCDGARLRPQICAVRFAGKAIHETTAMSVREAAEFFHDNLTSELPDDVVPVAQPLLRAIGARLRFLNSVGLGYLTLDRTADTLSGGEAERVRLATHIGLGLAGVCYILDEPTIGLHPRDNDRLLEALVRLRDQGSSVLVVEHDEAAIRRADWVIDLGPEAGSQGGRLVAMGPPERISENPESITGQYLSGKSVIRFPNRRAVDLKNSLKLFGVRTHNLKAIDVAFPTGALVCVTGVSGSGKSSLVTETLSPALTRKLHATGPKPGPYDRLVGARLVERVIEIDQRPIGRTPRSNPATYTGAFEEIRRVFTQTREARLRGYKPGRFSFNVKGGRCEQCQGQGIRKIEMHFLPDLEVECDACRGARFNRQTLEIRYRGKSIADVLAMQVVDSLDFFENFPAIHRILATLEQVGLGYLTLGQSSTTLSGGEAQRVKLATELARTSTGKSLYLFDEPTTGLHFADVRKLLDVLIRLAEMGNTLVVIEHNLDVIKSADYVIDLGPEGGEAGGEIVVTGTPEEVADCAASHTGRFLKTQFERQNGRV